MTREIWYQSPFPRFNKFIVLKSRGGRGRSVLGIGISVFRYYRKWKFDTDTELPNDYANLLKYTYRKLGWELAVSVFWAFLKAFWCFEGLLTLKAFSRLFLWPFERLESFFLVPNYWIPNYWITMQMQSYQNTEYRKLGEKIPKYRIPNSFFLYLTSSAYKAYSKKFKFLSHRWIPTPGGGLNLEKWSLKFLG